MPEWWTYTLSDFLMFSPRTYYRMLERHNEALWPGQVVAIGLGLGILILVLRPAPVRGRIVSILLAAIWGWVAWAFLWERYGAINRAAALAAPAFAIEALLLLGLAVVRPHVRFAATRDAASGLGLALLAAGVAVYPALAPLAGRPWGQAEVFGIAPDPTAVATLGLLLRAQHRLRWVLLVVPVLWCALSSATLHAMGTREALVPGLAALLAVGVHLRRP